MDCSPPDSSVHGISKARVLEWVAISFSMGSSWPRDQTPISCLEHPLLFLENFLLTPWDPLRVSPALGSLSWSPTGGATACPCVPTASWCVRPCHRITVVRSYLSLSPGDCKLLKGLCLLPQHTPRTQHWLHTQQTSTCSKMCQKSLQFSAMWQDTLKARPSSFRKLQPASGFRGAFLWAYKWLLYLSVLSILSAINNTCFSEYWPGISLFILCSQSFCIILFCLF